MRLSPPNLALLGLAVTACLCAGPANAQAGPSFSAERAEADLRYLSDRVGSRAVGTPAGGLAADYIASQLAAAELSVTRQSFSAMGFVDGGSTIEVTGPRPSFVPALTAVHSEPGDLSANLVYAGLGRPQDLESVSVVGRIALIDNGDAELRNADKVSNLATAGALAVVMANDRPGPWQARLNGSTALPTVCVSQEDGQSLRLQAQDGELNLHLVVRAETMPAAGANVIGTRAGGPGLVIIAGHYDSVRMGPGANDNASGVATMLELARATIGHSYPFALRFIAFDGEEAGRLGSLTYVEQQSDTERASLIAMINLDMEGVGNRVVLGGDDRLVAGASDAAGKFGITVSRLRPEDRSRSDDESFADAGLPTLFVTRLRDPRQHTAADQSIFIQPENLETAGRIVLGLLERLAGPDLGDQETTRLAARLDLP